MGTEPDPTKLQCKSSIINLFMTCNTKLHGFITWQLFQSQRCSNVQWALQTNTTIFFFNDQFTAIVTLCQITIIQIITIIIIRKLFFLPKHDLTGRKFVHNNYTTYHLMSEKQWEKSVHWKGRTYVLPPEKHWERLVNWKGRNYVLKVDDNMNRLHWSELITLWTLMKT